MRTFRKLITVLTVAAVFSVGAAGPAVADEPAPQIGSVCHPWATQPAARTVDFWLQNRTNQGFWLIQSHLDHGVWDGTAPPVRIEAWEWVCWRSKSSGFMTGTQGWAVYALDGTDGAAPAVRLTLRWKNPYWGGNSFGCTLFNHSCIGRPGSGGGNHPTPIFELGS